MRKSKRPPIKNPELIKKKREQIARRATKIFIKKGSPQTNMREISKVTGITIGSLYDYITKKEDVLRLVFDYFHDTWVNHLEKQEILEIEDPVEQLRTSIRKMLDLTQEMSEMILLLYQESKYLPKDFLKISLAKEAELVKFFESILTIGVEKKIFKVHDTFFWANLIVYLFAFAPLRGWNLKKHYTGNELNDLIEENILRCIM